MKLDLSWSALSRFNSNGWSLVPNWVNIKHRFSGDIVLTA